MVRRGILGISVVFALFFATSTAFAQESVETSEQTTLSGDLQNNPVAQDILKKIEQTKKWIADLEQRNYEKLEAQKALEEKRAQSLQILNQDLADWEKLWEYYSSYNAFDRFVDKIPDPQVQDVFWDQFEFKEQKVKSGRDAFKQVLADGGSRRDALQAYLAAAETKRIELIETNSQFNVNHNLAYYSQQILFDKDGQFIDSPITGEQLRKYYEDYRSNPAYLQANPDDAVSWEDLSKTTPNTECREGHVVVYRFHADDYVCVSVFTAEMWVRHGMGEITGDTQNKSSQEPITPLTNCHEGFVVIFNLETEKYSCVLFDTAQEWIGQGLAEFHSADDYVVTSIENKEVSVRVEEVNLQIREMKKEFEEEKIDLKNLYDKKYDEALAKSKSDEKNVTIDYSQRSGMSKEELSTKIGEIRENYESEKEMILKKKINDFMNLEKEFNKSMKELVLLYEDDPYVEVRLNMGHTGYEAVSR
ncbi:hypothetical protein [Candidatus Nitrosopumilus sediminis]|uniref:Uncharacterized protein n=1 Tax=Candidatus Nitrosopumilus sediminis TaxID=1229909 RepID=K0BAR5_9ARCH|nr:hypothetical protein [Candidatus Nitrosopumilus sediminis]AFS82579.1 hypothetical protein NSED_03865 [Candidatus Nitrosopumilus sediminis]